MNTVRCRPKLGRRTGAMCFHTFKELVDAVPRLERLTLQGLGEPLLAPDLFHMLEYAAERGIRAGFNTNGTLLTRPISERLVALGVDWLHVSLDGATAETYEGIRDGSDFARVYENVRNLVEVMQNAGRCGRRCSSSSSRCAATCTSCHTSFAWRPSGESRACGSRISLTRSAIPRPFGLLPGNP